MSIFDTLSEELEGPREGEVKSKPTDLASEAIAQENNTELSSKKIKDLEEFIRQQSEEMEKIKDGLSFQEKLKDVFTGTEKEQKEKMEELAEREGFEGDPYSFVVQKMNDLQRNFDEKIEQRVSETVNPIAANQTLEKVKRELSTNYDIVIDGKRSSLDDPKVAERVTRELNTFSSDAIQRDPKRYIGRAAWLAGVLKKKKSSGLPSYEGGGGYEGQASQDYTRSVINKIKGSGSGGKVLNI